MKKLTIFYWFLTAILLIGISSCKKSFMDPSININPNNPAKATDASLLPAIIVPAAYNTGGSLSWISSLWDQQTFGISNQYQSLGLFITATSDYDLIWTNIYQQTLQNAVILNNQATKEGNIYYAGIAKVLFAYQMGLTTDMWGDVPYSNAFKGASGVTTPTFDKQQDIYVSLFKLLDSAKTELAAAKGGPVTPGSDDVSSYAGNQAAWLKLANVLTARLSIHLANIDPKYAQNAIDAINAGGFASNADNFSVAFGTDQNSNNPNYQLTTQRTYLNYGGGGLVGGVPQYLYLPHTMFGMKDPRLSTYITNYNDTTANADDLGDYFGSKKTSGAPVVMVTLAEQNFILAEAYLRIGNTSVAQTAYLAGINASMAQFGISSAASAAYIAANGTLPGSVAGAMNAIMSQKYFALYLNPEVYTDWRRTGYPVLISPVPGKAIPRRLLYPLQEYSFNSANVPPAVNLTTAVWWDKH